MFGIPKKSMDLITGALSAFPEIEKASFFGSRAMGNYKNGSDVDLVVYGSRLTPEMLNRLSRQLNEELPLAYYFDLVHYDTLQQGALKNHIDEYAKCFYKCPQTN
jgi:predicted nucleotidyltransferase